MENGGYPVVNIPGASTEQGPAPSSSAPLIAIVVIDAERCRLPIAALSVLDRLVVTLGRAGVSRMILVGPAAPTLSRSTALGFQVEQSDRFPAITGPVLVSAGNVLTTVADLRNVIARRGRLAAGDGQRLPLGIVEGASRDWQSRLDLVPAVRAQGPAACVTGLESARQVERAYWASLTSSSDGLVDRHFNRPVGRWLGKRLVSSPVTPNQVSVAATLIGLISAWLFVIGTPGTALAGALALQGSAIVDCIDGDLARALYKESALGKWLDIVGDQVVHIGVFLGLGIGLWRSGSSAPVVTLGIIAAGGVVLSFLVILRVLLQPKRRGQGRLQKLIDATTNRDFSVLLILFALIGVLDWFLWLAAVGSHLFWLIALALQMQENRPSPDHAQTA